MEKKTRCEGCDNCNSVKWKKCLIQSNIQPPLKVSQIESPIIGKRQAAEAAKTKFPKVTEMGERKANSKMSPTEISKFVNDATKRIDTHNERTRFDVAHLVRSHHENQAKGKVCSKLKPNQAVITIDWKMKWLATTFRESQEEWFGKAGMIWQGTIVVKNKPNATEAQEKQTNKNA